MFFFIFSFYLTKDIFFGVEGVQKQKCIFLFKIVDFSHFLHFSTVYIFDILNDFLSFFDVGDFMIFVLRKCEEPCGFRQELRRCCKPYCGITIPSSRSSIFCGMYRLWTCSQLCGKPWKSLSDMCGSNPKQRTICKRWFTFHWCQAFHHHFAEGHERAQKLMLQLVLGLQDCSARCLGQEAVLHRWRLSTRLGSDAPLLSLPPHT